MDNSNSKFRAEQATKAADINYSKMPRNEAIILLLQNFGMNSNLANNLEAKKIIIDYVNYIYGEKTPVDENHMLGLRDFITTNFEEDKKKKLSLKDGLFYITDLDSLKTYRTYYEKNGHIITEPYEPLKEDESKTHHGHITTDDFYILDIDSNNRLLVSRTYSATHVWRDHFKDSSGKLIQGEQSSETFTYSESAAIDHGIEMDVTYNCEFEKKFPDSAKNKITSATLLLERTPDILSRASGTLVFSTSEEGEKEYELNNIMVPGPQILDHKPLSDYNNLYFIYTGNPDTIKHEVALYTKRPMLPISKIDQLIMAVQSNKTFFLNYIFKPDRKTDSLFNRAHNRLLNSSEFRDYRNYIKDKSLNTGTPGVGSQS